jgi:glyceraldehyde 3-phosphate dehydrogenase
MAVSERSPTRLREARLAAKIAINGFGRIGRSVARILTSRATDLELVAINDLTDAGTLAHLLAFDSVHGALGVPVAARGSELLIDGRVIPVHAVKDPAALPWAEHEVDVVLECTGRFRHRAELEKHLAAGAKRVVLSAPAKDALDATFCVGINDDSYDPSRHRVVSNASCTTNCLAPMVKVIDDVFGLKKAHMLTVHSYTNDQSMLDQPHKDLRRARAAGLSMIPTSTGAASAIAEVLPEMRGRLTGASIRVPTPDVSITCLTAHIAKSASAEAVNDAFRAAAQAGKLARVLAVEDRPLVSVDYVGNPYSCILDTELTSVIGGDLVQIEAWYDNEWGFSNRMVDLATMLANAKGG